MYAVIETGGKQYKVESKATSSTSSGSRATRSRCGPSCWSTATRCSPRPSQLERRVRDRPGGRRGQGPEDQRLHVQEQVATSGAAGATGRTTPRSRSPGSRRAERGTAMSKKKGAASSRNGRDSNAQRLGVKRFSGQTVTAGHDHRPPARHEVPPRLQRRARERRHVVRHRERRREVRHAARPQARRHRSRGHRRGVTAGGEGTMPPPASR